MINPILKEDANRLKALLEGIAPVVAVQYSALGGADRAGLYLMISLDPRESWANGILENSRYIRVSVNRRYFNSRKAKQIVAGYEIEHFSGGFTFAKGSSMRKAKVETFSQVADKIREYVEKFPRYEMIKGKLDEVGGLWNYQTMEKAGTP